MKTSLFLLRNRSIEAFIATVALLGQFSAAATWREHTFADFRQGHSDDGGVNLYAAADGTVRAALSFDYNRDGANDILYVCSRDNAYAPPS